MNTPLTLGIDHSSTAPVPSMKKAHNAATMGRPTVMTPEVIQKLEDAFAYCYTDKEACLYAGISSSTLYNYQVDHPDFVERKEALRLTPNLAAKRELVVGMKDNLEQARWWATHKMGDDFAPKSRVEMSGGVKVESTPIDPAQQAIVDKFNKEMRESIAAGHKKP